MSVQQNIYRQRVQFSKIRSLVPIPNLIDIQKRSYDEFLQMNLLHTERDQPRTGGPGARNKHTTFRQITKRKVQKHLALCI